MNAPQHDEPTAPTTGQLVNDTLAEMAPWLSSAVFHLGLIVLALFAVWMTAQMDEPEPILVARPNPLDPHRQLLDPTDPADHLIDDASPVNFRTTAPPETSPHEEFEKLTGVIGGQPSSVIIKEAFIPQPIGPTAGTGSSTIFDPPMGTAFSSVVYVIDASGSLVGDLGPVIDQLRQSIGQLTGEQKFTVIFFQRDLAIEVPPRGLKSATAATKKKVLDWVTPSQGNIVPGGTSNPIAALTVALRYRPQVLFLLSDNITGRGRYEVNRQALLDEISTLNADHRTQVHTIQFLYPDPLGTLDRIAREQGGTHRFVSESDLRLGGRRGL